MQITAGLGLQVTICWNRLITSSRSGVVQNSDNTKGRQFLKPFAAAGNVGVVTPFRRKIVSWQQDNQEGEANTYDIKLFLLTEDQINGMFVSTVLPLWNSIMDLMRIICIVGILPCQLLDNILIITWEFPVNSLPLTWQHSFNYLAILVRFQLPGNALPRTWKYSCDTLPNIWQYPASYITMPCQLPINYITMPCQLPVNYMTLHCQLPVNYITMPCRLPVNYMTLPWHITEISQAIPCKVLVGNTPDIQTWHTHIT